MNSPIIIIGMHRSGTSMIAELLRALGLHTGWLRQKNGEAIFFLERNSKLLSICGGHWENPQQVQNLLQHPEMRERATTQLLQDMQSIRFLSYLGPRHCGSYRSIENLNFPWGWKDPRNTFLLPLWLDLFPEAKIIHIYRHPVDVVLSLAQRQQSEIKTQLGLLDQPSRFNGTTSKKDRDASTLQLYRFYAAAQRRIDPLYRYDKMFVAASCCVTAGFALWRQYVEKSLAYASQIKNPFLNIQYEDFLAESERWLHKLAEFCELPASPEQVMRLVGNLNPDRRYAFKHNEAACQIFEQWKQEPLVRKLGYDLAS